MEMPPIAPHSTATSDAPWDGPANKARIPASAGASELRKAYAWRDPDKDADTKVAYRFIHHEVSDSGNIGAANVQGARMGIGVLNGARGGTTIPAADRQGVYDHLAKHLRDAGVDPAPLKAEADLPDLSDFAPDDAATAADPVPITPVAGIPTRQLRRAAWALPSEVMADVADFLTGKWTASEVEARLAAGQLASQARPATQGKIAVLPLQGLLTPRLSLLSLLFGGGSGLMGFRVALAEAASDSTVDTIVIDIDSPGGLTDLIPETAAEVRAARESGKRVVAHANVRALSGAYWIASQADEVVVSPSGGVGSIGVLQFHEDVSKADEQAGIKTTIISAGKFKAEGNPYEPLSDEARASMQAVVDDFYSMFTADVARGRDTTQAAVEGGFGQGRAELASVAVESGLADTVEPLDATLARYGVSEPTIPAPASRKVAADLLLSS